jgi:hypothetical protein
MIACACWRSCSDSCSALVGQPLEAHVGIHFTVDEILVDGGQFAGEEVVQQLDDLCVAFHETLRKPAVPGRVLGWGKRKGAAATCAMSLRLVLRP